MVIDCDDTSFDCNCSVSCSVVDFGISDEPSGIR
jgi:hypothetical protein